MPAKPLPHGGNIEEAAQAWGCQPQDILDLSTGLHPDGAPAWLGEWLRDHADLAAIYPERNGEPARSALAAEFGVAPSEVLITAGAQAAIETIFSAFNWQSMAIRTPCYSEPLRCARRANCSVISYSNGSPPPADVVWLTCPDNPSGSTPPPLPERRQQVWDESYAPFSKRRRVGIPKQTIRIGSLTKTFCIPGLRLGYLIAPQATIAQLQYWLPPWPAATQALHLLPKLLPEADLRDRAIVVARQRLTELLQLHQWSVQPSDASFILAKPSGAMPDCARHRILLRSFPEWPQLSGWIRFGLPGSTKDWQRITNLLTLRQS
ncbi:MAG: aminotransferase class I/II-fold pyridoxal phosphate-dependent enzyme [Mariprofundales bacterium]